MPKNNVILTGMPGSGKSTVGVILAKELCLKFLDVDVLMQTGENMTLQEIIDRRGLEEFLALEETYTLQLTVDNTVIAPGGSVVLSDQAMNALGKNGIIVFLDVPLETIKRRIDIYTRGIVKQSGEAIEDVWRKRAPLYRSCADYTVACGTLSQTEIVNDIVRHIGGILRPTP